MKIKHIIASAAFMLIASSAMAQYVDTDNYTRLQASFIANRLSNDGNYGIEPKGLSVGLIQGYSVSDVYPIFLEFGANLQFAHSAKDYSFGGKVVDSRFTYMNVAVPVNGVYKFTLNDKVAFSGHAGLNFKLNMLALQKSDEKIYFSPSSLSPTDKLNLLSKDDMGSRANRGNIFQLGGQIGAGVHLSDFYIGWQFQSDIMNFLDPENGDKQRWHTNYITIGYTVDLSELF